jgi:hypothetical protein
MALLLVRFRVRLRTDIPTLYSDEGIIEHRLEPYLSIFLTDKNKKLIEAIDAGKEFFRKMSEEEESEFNSPVKLHSEIKTFKIDKSAAIPKNFSSKDLAKFKLTARRTRKTTTTFSRS